MSSAEFTVLLCLQTFWMILFFLCHVVVTLFAFRTCQCDLYAHDFSTSMCLLSPAAHVTAVYATSCYCDKDLFLIINFSFHCKFRHKKKDLLPVSLYKRIIEAGLCQVFSTTRLFFAHSFHLRAVLFQMK